MSKLETPMTRWYWRQIGGTLIEEFPAVRRTDACAIRLIDGVIIRRAEHRIASASEVNFEGQNIVVVQTKVGRVGMYLLGQAFFSAHLMMRFAPCSILSVALCQQNDSVLGPIFESYPNMKIVECPLTEEELRTWPVEEK